MDDMFPYHASHLFEHWIFCANQHRHHNGWCVHIPRTHNFSFAFLLCRYSHIRVNLSIPRVDNMSSWEQRWLGIPWTILPTALFAQRLRASLSLGSHTAMGYIPLVASCSFYRVYFAWYACFFAMQLWPLLASTHDSPLCYSYVYLHAWWRSLLLLPCLSCASSYWCYFAHILLSCLCYVMWIIHAHYLHPWHVCHDSF